MNRSRSLRVIVASLMTVLGILLTQFPNSALANPTPTPTSSASALTCKKYVFIGMRGSGENSPQMAQWINKWAQKWHRYMRN